MPGKDKKSTENGVKDAVREVVKEELAPVERRLTNVEEQLTNVDGRLTNVEKTMVTKDDLDEKLEKFVTKEYLDKRLENFATKDDLRETEQRFKNELWEVEQRFEEKLEESFRKYRDDVLTGLDKVMGELEKHRQERTIQNERYQQLEGRVKSWSLRSFRPDRVRTTVSGSALL